MSASVGGPANTATAKNPLSDSVACTQAVNDPDTLFGRPDALSAVPYLPMNEVFQNRRACGGELNTKIFRRSRSPSLSVAFASATQPGSAPPAVGRRRRRTATKTGIWRGVTAGTTS